MSRIVVKNLPKAITEHKLREIFEQKGTVTDLQLKYSKAGVFRKFAFVGYKNEEQAKEAQEYFHNTFVFTSKIKIEICTNLNDPNKPKPWKEFLQEKAEKAKLNEALKDKKKDQKDKSKLKQGDIPEELKKDPKFKEFLEVHENRTSKPVWADGGDFQDSDNAESASDDDGYGTSQRVESEYNEQPVAEKDRRSKGKKDKGESQGTSQQKVSHKKINISDDTYTVKLRNLHYSCKKKHIREFFKPLKIASLRIPPKNKGFAYVSFTTEKDLHKALIKHQGFLGGHKIDVIKYKRKETFESEQRHQQEKFDQTADMDLLVENGRMYVRNLCFSVTESDLEQLFSKYGELSELYLPIDRLSKKAQGFAFVTFLFAEQAIKAYTELDGSIFQGRMLHLIPAQPKKVAPIDENETNFKKKKEANMKTLSGSSHNWNMLFLGMNAVADVIAEKYNVEKSQLLKADNKESVAVRMALAETNVVLDTRKFLIENGVQLDAFSQAAGERSKTVIIVKHLPAKTSSEELHELFSKYGTVLRIVLPPTGLVALIEFEIPTQAKEAFTKLAYRRFKNLPLYLEWAPMDGLKDPPPKPEENEPTKKDDDKSTQEDEPDETADGEPPQGTVVFVKNINFTTTLERFKKHFEKCGTVLYAEIATKKDLKKGKMLSLGFGFVHYKRKKAAVKAVSNLQLSKLDGHALEVKVSNRATLPTPATKKRQYEVTKQLSSKFLVRNIPFQASEKDVKELFSQFGLLKSVRLPKKMGSDNEHRGFAFVEYVTKCDAKRAFESLCHSTHLFGRRLVLEWANPDSEDVEEIRKKTIKDFAGLGGKKQKLKKSKLNEDVALASARVRHDEDE